LNELFDTGRIVDLILLFVALEAVALIVYARSTARSGIAPMGVLTNLAAGTCLLLALRCALVASPWGWTAAWLLAALFAHLADLGQRWTR
jgi:hypothetical protein